MKHSEYIEKKLNDSGYELDSFLARGRNYDLAVGTEDETGRRIVVKSIRPIDSPNIEERIVALEREREVMEAFDSDSRFPGFVDWIDVNVSENHVSDSIPLLVYEYLEGNGLAEYVERGEPPEETKMASSLFDFADFLHRKGYLFRDYSPDHFIWTSSGELKVCGIGNVISLDDKPIKAKMKYEEAPYVAPEIRREYSGKTLLPQADIYGLGALLSFLLTGEHVKAVVENPLSEEAYRQLTEEQPTEINQIIAKCLQPLAKHRFEDVSQLRQMLESESTHAQQQSEYELPEPWDGVNEAVTEKTPVGTRLSSGPLVGRGKEIDESGTEQEELNSGIRTVKWGLFVVLTFAIGWLLWP